MEIIAITQKGSHHPENEDRIVVGQDLLSEGTLRAQLTEGCVAVADGVGGHLAGAVASQFVAQKLAEATKVDEIVLREINTQLLALAESNPQYTNMATTLSGFHCNGEELLLFSTGNTRIYLLIGGQYLRQLTQDDTTVNYLLSIGQLTPEEAAAFPRKNEITACFGGGTPGLLHLQLGNLCIPSVPCLMTSDGIHDHVSLDELEDILATHGPTLEACATMIAAARHHGSQDDASAILVNF